jgi:hypothetical protein
MSMFQRRHYEAVARQMKGLKASALVTVKADTNALWEMTVKSFSVMFTIDNSRFNPGKFLTACGWEKLDE